MTRLGRSFAFRSQRALFLLLLSVRPAYVHRVWRDDYRTIGRRSWLRDLIWTFGGPEYEMHLRSLPGDALAAHISGDAWRDTAGSFDNFARRAQTRHGAHAPALETLQHEGLRTVQRHHYPMTTLFGRLLAPGSVDVVEYGCGDGINYSYAAPFLGDRSFVGYDINQSAVQLAQQQYPDARFVQI